MLPCSSLPSPLGGISCSDEFGTLNKGKKRKFFESGFYFEQIQPQSGELQVDKDDATFSNYTLRPPWSLSPREPPTWKIDTGGSAAQAEVVTFTLKLLPPQTPVQTHLVQGAMGLEVTPGQVRVGVSFATDCSGELEIYHILEAFDDLKQTVDAGEGGGHRRGDALTPAAALR